MLLVLFLAISPYFQRKNRNQNEFYICFRPEDIELLPNAQTEAENQITVDIINTAFMGNITEVQGVIKRNDEEKKLRLQLNKMSEFER